MTVEPAQLSGWAPIRFYWRDAQAMMDWCHLGGLGFKDSFFDQTINQALRRPFSLLFRHQTPMEDLCELAARQPGVPPTGFIFHMSRCGSTLVSQMFTALESSVVISEAPPIDQVLRAQTQIGAVDEAVRVRWLRGVISALGQRHTGREQRFFVKFDSWHILQLPLIVRAFPEVPWIFIYRDPVEVMVSHHRQCGAQMMPGVIHPAWLGMETGACPSLGEFCARVLGNFCTAAAAHHGCGHGRLIHFRELPGAVTGSLLKFFGIECSEEELSLMRHAAQFNAKTPSLTFEDDSAAKLREATDDLRQLAQQWVAGPYEKLEQLRAAQAGLG